MADEYVYMKKATWTGICDNIRTKAGTTATMTASEAETAISGISTGGDINAEIAKLEKKEGYVNRSGNFEEDDMDHNGFYGVLSTNGFRNGDWKEFFQSLYMPNIESLSEDAFNGCTNLKKAVLPSLTVLPAECFYGCTALTDVELTKVERVDGFSFYGCTSLVRTDLPAVTELYGYDPWEGCTAFETLVIGTNDSTTVAPIDVPGNFLSNTKIASGTGYIYVADSLVDKYKAETNWCTFADQIKGISSLTS